MIPAPEHFETREGYAYCKLAGRVTPEQGAGLVTRALEYAVAQNITRLLVNGGNLEMTMPTLPDRYFAVREWARVAGGTVRLALVLPAEVIDPERFGPIVARNAGLAANIVSSESTALEWLLSNQD